MKTNTDINGKWLHGMMTRTTGPILNPSAKRKSDSRSNTDQRLEDGGEHSHVGVTQTDDSNDYRRPDQGRGDVHDAPQDYNTRLQCHVTRQPRKPMQRLTSSSDRKHRTQTLLFPKLQPSRPARSHSVDQWQRTTIRSQLQSRSSCQLTLH